MKTFFFINPSCFAAVLFSLVQYADAAIDFESIPGSLPLEGMKISNQFEADFGVSFSLSNGELPVLAKVGDPLFAFIGPGDLSDTAVPSHPGEYFLTDNASLGLSADLLIDYSTPVSAASGILLDIDFEESWTITAYNSLNQVVDQLILDEMTPNTGDGVPTSWSFDHEESDIARLRFSGYRPTAKFGLAFDNFSPATPAEVPLPAAAWFFLSGLCTLAYRPWHNVRVKTKLVNLQPLNTRLGDWS